MNRLSNPSAPRAAAVAACLALTALALAACGGSSNSGAAGGGTGTSPSSHASSPSSKPSGSGSSGSGSSTTVSSLAVPFPIAVGDTWTYRDTIGSQTVTTNKITAIVPTAGGEKVYMGHTYYIFHSDGSITLPFSQFDQNGSADASIKLISGTLEWPPASVIDSGQPTTSTIIISAEISGQKMTYTAHITVKGEGTQSVTVPAGTYSATILDMHEAFTILDHTEVIDIRTWVASGVGPVQTEVFTDFAGAQTLTAKTELVSFKQG
jgi:hypothetical protein